MKRFIFAMMLSAFAISMQAQTGVENSNPIDFQVGWHDEGAPTVPIKRSPVRPLKASLSGHTLYILTSHADYNLQLLSFDGTVVFETFVPSSDDSQFVSSVYNYKEIKQHRYLHTL